jgi:arginase
MCDTRPPVRRILVPYHHGDAVPALVQAFAADDAVVVSKGPLAPMLAAIAEMTATRIAATDEPALVVAADRLAALGTLAGLQRRGLTPSVLWLGAHAAFATASTTRDGYLGSLALAMLTGRGGAALRDPLGLRPIADEQCALVGVRALEGPERDALAATTIRRIDLAALDIAELPPPPWYVHLDADLLDPSEARSLRYPVPNGPTRPQVADALRTLSARGTIVALGLAGTFTSDAYKSPEAFAPFLTLADAITQPHG